MENNENKALGIFETGCFTAMVKTASVKIDVCTNHTMPGDYHGFALKAANQIINGNSE